MEVKKITDSTINELEKSDKAIVKYYADWCGSCRLFAPKFKKMATDEQFNGIDFLEVNAEENPQLRSLAEVANLPYFALFKDGKFVSGLSTAKEEPLIKLMEN
ncbi:MAG: thioredoxin family protein [Calditrichaeota bacterium]|nr:thioredoxin family protein [Calditrichota bacterium]